MKQLDSDTLDRLTVEARQADRRRVHLNLHAALDEPVQRLVVAMEPDSYIRPHQHPQPEKWEFFTVLRGAVLMLVFDAKGTVLKKMELTANGPLYCIELPPATWHTVVSLQPGSVFVEVKQGPYIALTDKDFAAWAPAENQASVPEFLQWLRQSRVGERPV